jgi:hypothetical protein
MQPVLVLELLILLAVANGTPVVAKRLFGGAFAQPLDGGALFADGRPWFGPSKTVRGVVLAMLATAAAAGVLGLGWKVGAFLGGVAMAGDPWRASSSGDWGSRQAARPSASTRSLNPCFRCLQPVCFFR